MTTYAAILADPPWHFAVRSPKGEGRSASKHYGTESLADLKAFPINSYAALDCALFLWAVDPMLPQALDLMAAWGFTFKTVGFYWAKTNHDGSFFTGMGYWTRANPEICLLGTRGIVKRKAKDVRRLVVSPRREHSRKPDEIHTRIERLVDGPYLELFGRAQRSGWTVLGNETDKFQVAA